MPSLGVLIILFIFILVLLVPQPALALTAQECGAQTIGSLGCLPFYFTNIANGAFALAGIAAVILITLSGIRLLLSGGDPVKVEKSKKSMTYAIIGFVIILLSFTILKAISLVTGAKCINVGVYDSCK